MSTPPGPLLARGRDADIYDLGGGLVLRRARDGRSLAGEADVMAYAHRAGLPVPRVHDVTADGGIVCERVVGPLLSADLLRRPWRTAIAAGVLAELHDAVHRHPAPEGLPGMGLPGDRLLHLDLHPFNVVLTAGGPVLLDWANARAGPAAADLAMTWVLLASGSVDGLLRPALAVVRRRLVAAFLRRVDRTGAEAVLPAVVDRRLADRNVHEREIASLRRLRARVAEPPG